MRCRSRIDRALAPLALLAACGKRAPEPAATARADAASAASAAESDAGAPGPARGAPAVDAARALADASASADLGWDLDANDPARDYVKRYVRATKRYGDLTGCVLVGKSADDRGRRAVQVRTTPGCGGISAVRDVFYVDVAGDRLTVDEPSARAPLARWPDGSAPDAPAAPVRELDAARGWRAPLASALRASKLAPVRVEERGRGTYLVVTLVDWREPIARDAPDDALKGAADRLCAANDGRSFALTTPSDARTWLRVRCDGTFKWDLAPAAR